MRRFFSFTAPGGALLVILAAFAGCSDDKSPTGGTQPGQLDDPSFLAVQALSQLAHLGETWERSVELSFALIEDEFFSLSAQVPHRARTPEAAQELVIDSADYSWSGASSWHVWHAKFTIYDEQDIVTGWAVDSTQVWAGNSPLSAEGITALSGMDEVDSLRIRTHFTWYLEGTDCSGNGDHSVTVARIPDGGLGIMLLNAVAEDVFHGGIDCLADSCLIELQSAGEFRNVTFPFEDRGGYIEPAECPAAGNATISATIDLNCIGSGDSPYDSLSVDGSWRITYSVLGDGEIGMSFSNGVNLWSYSDTCYADRVTVR